MSRIEHKIEMKQCKAKKHTFIPIAWRISASSHSATEFLCSSCLVTVEKRELEVFNQHLNCEIDECIKKESEGE